MAKTVVIEKQILNASKCAMIRRNYSECPYIPLKSNEKMKMIIMHFSEGVPWEETGIYEAMLLKIDQNGGSYKGLHNLENIKSYYKTMDKIYTEVRKYGLLIPEKCHLLSLRKRIFPMDGIFLEIGDEGDLYFAGRGTHRLGMSIASNMDETPVYLTAISELALRTGNWKRNVRAI
jgi:hypothetical protein